MKQQHNTVPSFNPLITLFDHVITYLVVFQTKEILLTSISIDFFDQFYEF